MACHPPLCETKKKQKEASPNLDAILELRLSEKRVIVDGAFRGAMSSLGQRNWREMKVNFTGSWNADFSRSRFLGTSPKALSLKIEHSDPELQQEMVLTKLDGTEERVVFTCRTDGEQDRSFLNRKAVRGRARWEEGELVIETWLQLGARTMHFCDCWSLSPDGQTLTMEHRGDDLAGQLTVLKRAG